MKDRWSQLSLKDKSDLMSLYIRNGISSLEEIKKHYNSFATGGQMNTDGSKEDKNIDNNIPNFVGGATALNPNYDYSLEHMADKYPVITEGPWHDYGIHNPSVSQKAHWNELARMYNRVAQRPDYEYLNPSNILEYTPVIGDAIDAAYSIDDISKGNVGIGVTSLGLLAMPNAIEKPLKGIGKTIINTLDHIRYDKYKKNAFKNAQNAYSNHLSRVGLTRNDIPSLNYDNGEEVLLEQIKQNGYDITNPRERVRYLRDAHGLKENISIEDANKLFIKTIKENAVNPNNVPSYRLHGTSSIISVGPDAGYILTKEGFPKSNTYGQLDQRNIILNDGKVTVDFPWRNSNNEVMKSHELTHYLQANVEKDRKPIRHTLIDDSKIENKINKSDRENTRELFFKNNATETEARLSQILDWYNITGNKKIKPSQIRYIKNNYRGFNNEMYPFLDILIDNNKNIADYLNSSYTRQYLSEGGKLN